MAVRVVCGDSVNLQVGGLWDITVAVTDDEGVPVAAVPTVLVTLPGGGTVTPTFELVRPGYFRVLYELGAEGRYLAQVDAGVDGEAGLTAYATPLVDAAGMPGLFELRGDPEADPPTYGYLGQQNVADADIIDALDAEAAAQRRRCRMPAAYPADLRQALMRRVAVNLAKRQLPLAMQMGDAEAGGAAAYVPGRDPEVRRLEGPHRRVVMG
jgi:hypothetical protein